MMNCGHRGIPYRAEEKRVSRLLRKSGFIPLLEEIAEERMTSSKQVQIGTTDDRNSSSKPGYDP